MTTLTILCEHGYLYVYREPTIQDFWRFNGNGYTCPPLVRENNETTYRYARGELKPNYPVPVTASVAISSRFVNSMACEETILD